MRSILITLAAIAAASHVANACDCLRLTISEAFDEVEFVFVGYLISAEHNFRTARQDSGSWRDLDFGYIEFRVHVEEVFKGDPDELPEKFKVIPGSCGYPVIVGAPYLIFTDPDGNTTTCLSRVIRNLEYDQEEDIVELRRLSQNDKHPD